MGVNIRDINAEINRVLDNMPKVLGEGAQSSSVYPTRRFEEVFVKAEQIAKDFKDSYISVEHVLLAIMDVDRNTVLPILEKFGVKNQSF